MHLLDRIAHWGRTSPEHIAHISNERTLTYGELAARSDALAAWLDCELGERRVPVAIQSRRCSSRFSLP